MQVLFHVDSANVGSLPLFISEEEDGDRILLSVGDKYLHKLKKDGPAFKKVSHFFWERFDRGLNLYLWPFRKVRFLCLQMFFRFPVAVAVGLPCRCRTAA